jgi:ubiquinone/menaquinone biosynthesis C-methylase UbiE
MNKIRSEYIPALSFDWLTAQYDSVMRWFMRESIFKSRLVEQGKVEKGQRVLDLGCGTATLAILIEKARPGADVIGIDGDRNILRIAEAKMRKQGLNIPLFDAMAFDLPCRDNYFDRVFASLLFHHLTRENKIRTIAEVHRVLKPGGELHVADFGAPQNALTRFVSLLTRHWEEASDNVQGLLQGMLASAGFEVVDVTAHYMTILGTLSLYRARKTG